jgi:putative transcriptional regulator
VPSKSRKLSPAELEAQEAQRDIGAEILQSIKDMKAGQSKVVLSPAVEAMQGTGTPPAAHSSNSSECVPARTKRMDSPSSL